MHQKLQMAELASLGLLSSNAAISDARLKEFHCVYRFWKKINSVNSLWYVAFRNWFCFPSQAQKLK
jgi:hypothetical protein